MGRAKRFFLHWLMFALYVILCSALVMVIEGGEQYNRQTKRMNLENEINETKNLIYRTVSHLISKTDEDQNKFLFNTDFSNRSELLENLPHQLDFYFNLVTNCSDGLKSSHIDEEWSLVNSLYYCSSLYTTVGYGDMICRTTGGKIFTILFILSSVPMWFSLLAQMGFFLQLLLVRSWRKVKTLFGIGTKNARNPPLIYLAFLTLLVMLLMSLFLSYVENVSYFDGVYFAVVTFSTVGLGDVVPKTGFGKLKCLFLSFNLGFAILSAWISNTAELFLNKGTEPKTKMKISKNYLNFPTALKRRTRKTLRHISSSNESNSISARVKSYESDDETLPSVSSNILKFMHHYDKKPITISNGTCCHPLLENKLPSITNQEVQTRANTRSLISEIKND